MAGGVHVGKDVLVLGLLIEVFEELDELDLLDVIVDLSLNLESVNKMEDNLESFPGHDLHLQHRLVFVPVGQLCLEADEHADADEGR